MLIFFSGLGMWQSCGHLDFYPNGGRIMAGCEKGIMNHIAGMCVEFGFFFSCLFTFFNFIFLEEKGNLAYALRRTLSCNHIRAYEYFIDSIKSENCQFIGIGR